MYTVPSVFVDEAHTFCVKHLDWQAAASSEMKRTNEDDGKTVRCVLCTLFDFNLCKIVLDDLQPYGSNSRPRLEESMQR